MIFTNLFPILFIIAFLFLTPSFAYLIINNDGETAEYDHPMSSSLRRLMSGSQEKKNTVNNNPRGVVMTCDRFPRVCRSSGSPGPDCCGKQCVDVSADDVNCGECGRRCSYGEKCCGGSCANVLYDRGNCGGCRSRCAKGSSCRHGMCDYA